MLTGRSFQLKRSTLAIESIDSNRNAVTVPFGAVLRVTAGPTTTDSRMIEVDWLGKHLVMFAVDLQERGEEIR